jgi:two-component system NtrC family sensor kinase
VAAKSLKNRILTAFLVIIFVMSASIAVLGYYIIKNDIIERAQQKVMNDLRVARSVYQEEIKRIGRGLELIDLDLANDAIKEKINLDYFVRVSSREQAKSEIAREAFERKEGLGGTRIIKAERLGELQDGLIERIEIKITPTARARPTDKKVLSDVMVKEYAMPVVGENGKVKQVIYGGRVINKDFSLVDRIRNMVYGNEVYDKKPIGTVTIFQDDTRVSTNVLSENGERAIGTRVSSEVYERVVEKGQIWQDRAFVVTHWYKTAYEPIRNISGDIIGILYVGVLEKPFEEMARNIILLFMGIVSLATLAAVVLAFVIASAISKPITGIVRATHKFSSGDYGHKVNTKTDIAELNKLGSSFNEMADRIEQREKSLKISNDKLAALNKSYVDLISFVSHELKGILASAIMNAYAVRDGYLGMINFKQRKAVDSVTRNLDYLDATVKKFLNLGRIERGELPMNKSDINLFEDVFETSIESLQAISQRKNIKIENKIDPKLKVHADPDLILVVANNLLSNAIKYGFDEGVIEMTSRQTGDNKVEVEVYNDSVPITEQQKDKLFKKFSRLQTKETKKIKGTGLGLFITKQIIESHGGSIRLETREKGNSFIFTLERSKESGNSDGAN